MNHDCTEGQESVARSGIRLSWLCLLLLWLAGPSARGGDVSTGTTAAAVSAAERGYQHLLERAYLPADFDQETFDEVWRSWPEPLRSQAERSAPAERREMAFQRYGLTKRPGDASGKPLQYVVNDRGEWAMNCFACHGGRVSGQVTPGLPNSNFALQTLTEEIRLTKLRLQKPLSRMDIGSLFMPLGTTNGTTNAVMFGVALMASRDPELNIISAGMPEMVHHDMDAPPWWNFEKRSHIYIDGFAEKSPRALMQFMLVKENGPERFREWEADFRDVYAYMESLEPPTYPYEVNRPLAAEGEFVFEQACAECHGTYGKKEYYPQTIVPIEIVGTDRVRLDALSVKHRQRYHESWFGYFGNEETIVDPKGYLAPPLDGVWASAPYLHNGSVPTLWHLLHPSERPQVWKRAEDPDSYDQELVGLDVEMLEQLPASVNDPIERRAFFDTRGFGKGAGGHLFPEQLSDRERRAVLEYLKTL